MAEQNSGKTKKQGFLQGAAILTFGTLLVSSSAHSIRSP